eukprot:3094785-Amphidinium_carterae.2
MSKALLSPKVENIGSMMLLIGAQSSMSQDHPNGLWTVWSFPSVICWHSDEHKVTGGWKREGQS